MDEKCHFTAERAKKNMEYYEDYSHKPYSLMYDACREIIRLNEVIEELERENAQQKKDFEDVRRTNGERVMKYLEEKDAELARLREQVRWRKYPEEKPGELTEVFAWDKDIDSIVLEYYANWEDTGYRFEDLHITYWMPLPEPPEVE